MSSLQTESERRIHAFLESLPLFYLPQKLPTSVISSMDTSVLAEDNDEDRFDSDTGESFDDSTYGTDTVLRSSTDGTDGVGSDCNLHITHDIIKRESKDLAHEEKLGEVVNLNDEDRLGAVDIVIVYENNAPKNDTDIDTDRDSADYSSVENSETTPLEAYGSPNIIEDDNVGSPNNSTKTNLVLTPLSNTDDGKLRPASLTPMSVGLSRERNEAIERENSAIQERDDALRERDHLRQLVENLRKDTIEERTADRKARWEACKAAELVWRNKRLSSMTSLELVTRKETTFLSSNIVNSNHNPQSSSHFPQSQALKALETWTAISKLYPSLHCLNQRSARQQSLHPILEDSTNHHAGFHCTPSRRPCVRFVAGDEKPVGWVFPIEQMGPFRVLAEERAEERGEGKSKRKNAESGNGRLGDGKRVKFGV